MPLFLYWSIFKKKNFMVKLYKTKLDKCSGFVLFLYNFFNRACSFWNQCTNSMERAAIEIDWGCITSNAFQNIYCIGNCYSTECVSVSVSRSLALALSLSLSPLALSLSLSACLSWNPAVLSHRLHAALLIKALPTFSSGAYKQYLRA